MERRYMILNVLFIFYLYSFRRVCCKFAAKTHTQACGMKAVFFFDLTLAYKKAYIIYSMI